MRAALLALAAWQLSPVQPLPYIQSTDTDSKALSNIELLIPLLVGEPAPRRARARDSRELDSRDARDERYSSIPAYAFALDEQPSGAPSGSRKRDLSRQQAPRMRSAYLEQPDDGRSAWRACARLARARSGAARQALRYLCAELLEPAPACACCGRRDFMPMGDDPAMVERYVHVARKKPRPPWLTE